ncbi:MAG: PilC/PilY family type IV pilus protein [Thiotrichaceae bacterium]
MNTVIKAAMETVMKTKTSRATMRINFGLLLITLTSSATASLLSIADAPLFVTNASKANVLVILDNSNSMDENATGAAVGSDSPNSKSEIARDAVKGLITSYTNKINMGLMAYQQDPMNLRNLDNSPYDVSYDPADWDKDFVITVNPVDNRNSSTKKFRLEQADNLGNYVYYNVALPYYHGGGALGATSYCYSNTANAFVDGENPITGPWDRYWCFDHKTGTSNAVFGNRAGGEADGYSGYQFSSRFSPTDSDLAQGITDFGARFSSVQIGQAWLVNTSPGRGYLHTPLADLDSTQAAALNTKLGVAQFATNAPTNPAFSLQNAGLTPLEGTLLTAKDYFEGNLTQVNEGAPAAAPPESCGKNFIALMTDGLPSVNKNGAVETNQVTSIADTVAAAAALKATSIGIKNGDVETYVIGFALPLGFDKTTTLDPIAKAGGTTESYFATDTATLTAAFDTIFSDILSKTGASSSAATNSTSLSSNSHIYQARFNSGDWSGQLLSTAISTSGVLGAVAWDAGDLLKNPTASARKIITYSRDSKDGIPFQWADVNGLTDTTQADILNSNGLGVADGQGQKRLNYLRGDASEEKPSGIFRERSTSKLGDIINSTPFFLGKPDAGHAESEMVGYTAFRNANSGRASIIYAGANDGMLHGFNADSGMEEIAYVPGAIYDELSDLTDPTYGAGASHRYFVDDSPMVADANLGNDTTPAWKTVLTGGYNAGGQGYYALDVTNATGFSEANAANLVLWEFTDEDDADMGYSFNQPTLNRLTNQSAQVARMANGRWALIVGNGYNNSEADGNASSTGHASLFILFLDGGTDGDWTDTGDYVKIDTMVGNTTTPNGLSTPRPIDTDGDGRIDTIYAGDLYGNMWKFDVSASTSGSWGRAYGATPLFTATDSSGKAQPITTAPVVTLAPGGHYLVGFGTGVYLGLSDVTNADGQTFYAVLDTGSAVAATIPPRGNLQAQTVLSTPTVDIDGLGTVETRVTSKNTVDYATKKGWYMDLPDTGERVAFNPILRDGRFVFTTLVPDTGVCSAGGSGWIMELDYLTGGALENSPFIGAPDKTSGIKPPGDGIPNTPTVIGDPDNKKELKIVNESTGDTDVISETVQYKSGRLSWREIR